MISSPLLSLPSLRWRLDILVRCFSFLILFFSYFPSLPFPSCSLVNFPCLYLWTLLLPFETLAPCFIVCKSSWVLWIAFFSFFVFFSFPSPQFSVLYAICSLIWKWQWQFPFSFLLLPAGPALLPSSLFLWLVLFAFKRKALNNAVSLGGACQSVASPGVIRWWGSGPACFCAFSFSRKWS